MLGVSKCVINRVVIRYDVLVGLALGFLIRYDVLLGLALGFLIRYDVLVCLGLDDTIPVHLSL